MQFFNLLRRASRLGDQARLRERIRRTAVLEVRAKAGAFSGSGGRGLARAGVRDEELMLNKHNFEIAALLPTGDDLPSTMMGLFVSPDRTIVTDGHQLTVVTKAEVQPTLFEDLQGIEAAEWFTPFLLDRDTALKIAKMIPKKDKDSPETNFAVIDTSTEASETATLAVTELLRQGIMKTRKISAEKYPEPERVMPEVDDARFTVSFNPEMLVPVLRAFQKFCADGLPQITLRLYDGRRGMRVDAENNGQTMTAVLMPQRMIETEQPVEKDAPPWDVPKPEAPAVTASMETMPVEDIDKNCVLCNNWVGFMDGDQLTHLSGTRCTRNDPVQAIASAAEMKRLNKRKQVVQ